MKIAVASTFFFAASPLVSAIDVDWNNGESIREAAGVVAWDLMSYYTGNVSGDVPGNLPMISDLGWYWWMCGAMFGTLIDYWSLTGDDTYNANILQGMIHQTGDERDFLPQNQSSHLGNDDVAFWAMTALTAAESRFDNPPEDQGQWIEIVENVFEEMSNRWALEEEQRICFGGLRWQLHPHNPGYDYKNAISNGAFFNIAARLARYTGEEVYRIWANRIFDWLETQSSFIVEGDGVWQVLDGSHDLDNDCQEPTDRARWSYNVGVLLHGSAVMYNMTDGDPVWRRRVEGLARGTDHFFPPEQGPDVMVERICEAPDRQCNLDQFSFKAYLSRWMGNTIQLAPFTYPDFSRKLRASAAAAAQQCVGVADGRTTKCGHRWFMRDEWDQTHGVGQQMSALSVIQATLITPELEDGVPVTLDNGGTSQTDEETNEELPWYLRNITTGDRVGAAFTTILALAFGIGMVVFCIMA